MENNKTLTWQDVICKFEDDFQFEELQKMAIADLKPGKYVESENRTSIYDYTHILPPEHVKNGYSIRIHDTEARLHPTYTDNLTVELWHKKHKAGPVGHIIAHVEPGAGSLAVTPDNVEVFEPKHKGKKLGSSMYEALLAHALHVKNAKYVKGKLHSTAASKTHQNISEKHGMDYKPTPNLDSWPGPTRTKEVWDKMKPSDFDARFGPYEYAIKSEENLEKGGPGSPHFCSVAVFNDNGQLLMGQRRDDGSWTFPGGGGDIGENPEKTAVRELMEESGFKPQEMHYLGSTNDEGRKIYVYKVRANGNPTGKHDPDQELYRWVWVDISGGKLPKDIMEHLRHRHNYVLQALGMQEKDDHFHKAEQEFHLQLTDWLNKPAVNDLPENQPYEAWPREADDPAVANEVDYTPTLEEQVEDLSKGAAEKLDYQPTVGERIHSQLINDPPHDGHGALEKTYHTTDGSEITKVCQKVGKLAHEGKLSLSAAYRAYKHTPHTPVAVLAKYMIHRVNHVNDYDDAHKSARLDEDFLGMHQKGAASVKNGHLNIHDLKTWATKNHHLVDKLVSHRDHLQKQIKRGIGLNTKEINGELHVALTRGLHSAVMNKEHALSSWADIPDPNFGHFKHHAWIPLKDIWYSYDVGPKSSTSESFGNENEWLVSDQLPKYESKQEYTTPSRLKKTNSNQLTKMPGTDWVGPEVHHPHLYDDTTEDQIIDLINKGKITPNNDYLYDSAISDKFTEKFFNAVKTFYEKLKETIPYAHVPDSLYRFAPESEIEKRIDADNLSYKAAAKNPNLTTRLLHKAFDANPRRVLRYDPKIVNIHSADEPLIRKFYSALNTLKPQEKKSTNGWGLLSNAYSGEDRENASNYDSGIKALLESPKTPHDVINHILENNKDRPSYGLHLLENPNHSEDHGQHAYDTSSDYNKVIFSLSRANLPEGTQSSVLRYGDAQSRDKFIKRNPYLKQTVMKKIVDDYIGSAVNISDPTDVSDHFKKQNLSSLIERNDLPKDILNHIVDSLQARADTGFRSADLDYANSILTKFGKENPDVAEKLLLSFPTELTAWHFKRQIPLEDVELIARKHPDNQFVQGVLKEKLEYIATFGDHIIKPLPSEFRKSEDLEKNVATIRLPKLGVQSGEVPYVTSIKGLDAKTKQLATAEIDHPANPKPKNRTEAIENRSAGLYVDAGRGIIRGVVGPPRKGISTGFVGSMNYASSHKIAERRDNDRSYFSKLPKNIRNNANSENKIRLVHGKSLNATQQHESLHYLFSQVEAKYGHGGREALAKKLVQSIPSVYRNFVNIWAKTRMPKDTHPSSIHEETLTYLYNYLTDPSERARFHDSYGHNDEKRTKFGAAMKRAHKYLVAAAEVATPEWTKSEEELEKGWKDILVGGAILGSTLLPSNVFNDKAPSFPTQVVQKVKQTFSKLHPHLDAISQLESSGGKNINHKPHSMGPFYTAVGNVALKPVTAYDTFSKDKNLKAKFPNIKDTKSFIQNFKNGTHFYNTVANHHWQKLLNKLGSPDKAAFGWRWGTTAAMRADNAVIHSDGYVKEFKKLISVKKDEESFFDELIKSDNFNPEKAIHSMIGYERRSHLYFDAARLMSSDIRPLLDDEIKEAVLRHDDPIDAALTAYNIPITHDNRKTLISLTNLSHLSKTEGATFQVTSDNKEFSDTLNKAIAAGQFKHYNMGGKNTKDVVIVTDLTGTRWMLKPNTSRISPAKGVNQEFATQAKRETAFYKIAKFLGLKQYVPTTELVMVGDNEYAAIQMIQYKNLDDIRQDEPEEIVPILSQYQINGTVYYWAFLDYVLGNPDRHAGNMMVGPSNSIALIDHGSAFAGEDFNPGKDKNAFIPYYLRFNVPDFSDLDPSIKVRYMPSLTRAVEGALANWIDGINFDDLKHTLIACGVDAIPVMERFNKLKAATDKHMFLNRFFAGVLA